MRAMEIIRNYSFVDELVISLIILIFKQRDDCLQGINRLEYLLKVSIFQKRKKELDNKPWLIENSTEVKHTTDPRETVESIRSSMFSKMLDNGDSCIYPSESSVHIKRASIAINK